MNPGIDLDTKGLEREEHGGTGGSRSRVLFVDNSVVLRTGLRDLFKDDSSLEAFTSPAATEVALLNLAKVRPHLAVIDADQDWTTLESLIVALVSAGQQVKVVLITCDEAAQKDLKQKGKSVGAIDCWLKSAGFRKLDTTVRKYLTEQTAAALGRRSPGVLGLVSGNRVVSQTPINRSSTKKIVVIGVSTGGPEALSVLLPLLSDELNVPLLIVQHTLASFTSLLVERLQKRTAMTVVEASDGMVVEGGKILIAPGNRHMQISMKGTGATVVLDDGPPENSCRPAVDPLFRSAARVYGAAALGVVLTGMGQDGLAGCRDLKRAGATILVQDQASSTVWGMPGQVAQAGLADSVLDLRSLAAEILRRVGVRRPLKVQA